MAEFLPATSSSSLGRGGDPAHSINWGLPGRQSADTLPRLYMTGDLRAVTGLSRTQLDFYLRDGLVRPTARTESGFLLFDDAEVELVQHIVNERRSGVALKEIRRRIGR
ncbi:MAG: MerR family transcriptional regulator [Thermomicrobiales bacterium]|nr:MerR family transcriptional regulator [Thermomicrobiales bacterium]